MVKSNWGHTTFTSDLHMHVHRHIHTNMYTHIQHIHTQVNTGGTWAECGKEETGNCVILLLLSYLNVQYSLVLTSNIKVICKTFYLVNNTQLASHILILLEQQMYLRLFWECILHLNVSHFSALSSTVSIHLCRELSVELDSSHWPQIKQINVLRKSKEDCKNYLGLTSFKTGGKIKKVKERKNCCWVLKKNQKAALLVSKWSETGVNVRVLAWHVQRPRFYP